MADSLMRPAANRDTLTALLHPERTRPDAHGYARSSPLGTGSQPVPGWWNSVKSSVSQLCLLS